jgi:hypothetical protein
MIDARARYWVAARRLRKTALRDSQPFVCVISDAQEKLHSVISWISQASALLIKLISSPQYR